MKKKQRGTSPRAGSDRPEAGKEAEAFERAMADVVRLEADPRGRVRRTRDVSPATPAASSDESPPETPAEFVAADADRRELRKLRRGEYPVGARCDLHGMTVAEARDAVRRFLANSRHRRLRCVCLVHGRGLHSNGGVSPLKTAVRECLRSHPLVLAYADAPADDGGPGAAYVLLRT